LIDEARILKWPEKGIPAETKKPKKKTKNKTICIKIISY